MLRPMLSVTDVYPIGLSQMWQFDYEHNYIKVAQLRPPVTKIVIGSINWAQGNQIMSSFYHFENCILMTRNALSTEAVGRRANNVLLPHSIHAWDNDCWSNKVIEEQFDQRQIPLSKLEQYCMGCWPGLITDRYLPQRLNSHQRHIPRGTMNSPARVTYNKAHGW